MTVTERNLVKKPLPFAQATTRWLLFPLSWKRLNVIISQEIHRPGDYFQHQTDLRKSV